MLYQIVYKDHQDDFGNYLVRSYLGYAGTPTGIIRRWRTAELAARYVDSNERAADRTLVWLPDITVTQGRIGQPSMRHQPSTAVTYKTLHLNYPDTGRATCVGTPHRNEIPVHGAVHCEGNEEPSSIPDAVVILAMANTPGYSSWNGDIINKFPNFA